MYTLPRRALVAVGEFTFMALISGTKTEFNLRVSFSRLAQTSLRFQYFALRADNDQLPSHAALLRVTAEDQASSASAAFNYLAPSCDPTTGQPLDDLPDMIRAAILSLTRDHSVVYPYMAATAREEGFARIGDWFELVGQRKRRFARSLEHALALTEITRGKPSPLT